MSDPVLSLILIVGFAAAVAVARFFKTLEPEFWTAARTPVMAGLLSGLLVRLLDASPLLHAVLIGVFLTVAALYVRLTGGETEASDGMLLGGLSGAAASLPLVINGDSELRVFSECTLAGAVAGFGVTVALFHVGNKVRQFLLDVVTAGAAVAAAWVPTLAARFGVSEAPVATGVAALIPLLVIGTVFGQWPEIRAELKHEATLGFMDDSDVRRTANPLLRLGRGGWTDRQAHREFVRVANQIALRKRRQHDRSDDTARIYQLEIIKLRTQLREMKRIDRLAAARRAHPVRHGEEVPSDTIARD